MKVARILNLLIVCFLAAGIAFAISFWEITAYSFSAGPVGIVVPFLFGLPFFGPAAVLGGAMATFFDWRFGCKSFGLLLVCLVVWSAVFLALYLQYMKGSPKIDPDFVPRILFGHVVLSAILSLSMRFGYVGADTGEMA